jgi:hypothetical protein
MPTTAFVLLHYRFQLVLGKKQGQNQNHPLRGWQAVLTQQQQKTELIT